MKIAKTGIWTVAALVLAIGAPGPARGQEQGRENVLQAVERIRVDSIVTGRLAEALAQLDELQREADAALAAKPDAEGRRQAVLVVKVARAEVLGLVGERDAALALLAEAEAATQYAELQARVARARESLARALDQDLASIEQSVRQALESGNLSFLRVLGDVAVPAMVEWIRANPDEFYEDLAKEPLYALVQIADLPASQLALELLGRGGLLWKKRLIRVMRKAAVFSDDDNWDPSVGFPPQIKNPTWLRVVELLVEDVDVGREATPLLADVVEHGGLTPRLQARLVADLLGSDPERRRATSELFSGAQGRLGSDSRAVLEGALESDDASVRKLAASLLVAFEDSPALRARAQDPSPDLRVAALRLFLPRLRTVPRIGPSGAFHGWGSIEYQPELTASDRELVVRSLDDEDPRVRAKAVGLGRQHAIPVEAARLVTLARDPDRSVRIAAFDWLGELPAESSTPVLATLAASDDPQILELVDQKVDWGGPPALVLPIFVARYRNPAAPWDEDALRAAIARMSFDWEADLNRILAWAIEWDDDALLRTVWEAEPVQIEWISREILAPYLERLWEADPTAIYHETYRIFRTGNRAQEFDVATGRALLEVAQDTRLPGGLRLAAASAWSRQGGDAFVDVVTGSLRETTWTQEELDDYVEPLCKQQLSRAPDHDLDRIVLALVRDAAVPDQVAATLAAYYGFHDPLAPDIAHAILGRWRAEPRRGTDALRRVLSHMAGSTELADPEVLRWALTRNELAGDAIGAMGATRDPRFLPDLARVLETSSIGDGRWETAVGALTGYLSDEAAEVLLQGAGWADSKSARDQCLAAVESIRAYQDARERWASRRVKQKTREDAIAELQALLGAGEPAQRVQAVRALATLEALEALPGLIGLLADPDAGVRSAAKEALDHLNDVGRRPPAGAGD